MAAKKGVKRVVKAEAEGRALVLVSPDLHKQLKMYAAEHETNVRTVVDAAVREFLKKGGDKDKK
jgi:hypothetical protein